MRFEIQFFKTKTFISTTVFLQSPQALAYEVCDRMCMPLHTSKTVVQKKNTPCLIQRASRFAADLTSKMSVFYLSLSIKHKDHTRKSCFYFLFHWFSGENCMFLFSLHKGRQTSKELKRNMNDRTFSGVFTYRLNLKNCVFSFFLSDTR